MVTVCLTKALASPTMKPACNAKDSAFLLIEADHLTVEPVGLTKVLPCFTREPACSAKDLASPYYNGASRSREGACLSDDGPLLIHEGA